jgi:hypothetical protein
MISTRILKTVQVLEIELIRTCCGLIDIPAKQYNKGSQMERIAPIETKIKDIYKQLESTLSVNHFGWR